MRDGRLNLSVAILSRIAERPFLLIGVREVS